jgi:hypothetical protein
MNSIIEKLVPRFFAHIMLLLCVVLILPCMGLCFVLHLATFSDSDFRSLASLGRPLELGAAFVALIYFVLIAALALVLRNCRYTIDEKTLKRLSRKISPEKLESLRDRQFTRLEVQSQPMELRLSDNETSQVLASAKVITDAEDMIKQGPPWFGLTHRLLRYYLFLTPVVLIIFLYVSGYHSVRLSGRNGGDQAVYYVSQVTLDNVRGKIPPDKYALLKTMKKTGYSEETLTRILARRDFKKGEIATILRGAGKMTLYANGRPLNSDETWKLAAYAVRFFSLLFFSYLYMLTGGLFTIIGKEKALPPLAVPPGLPMHIPLIVSVAECLLSLVIHLSIVEHYPIFRRFPPLGLVYVVLSMATLVVVRLLEEGTDILKEEKKIWRLGLDIAQAPSILQFLCPLSFLYVLITLLSPLATLFPARLATSVMLFISCVGICGWSSRIRAREP